MSNEDLPSIEWKQPQEAGQKHPYQYVISFLVYALYGVWFVTYGPRAQGDSWIERIPSVVWNFGTNPILWALGLWYLWAKHTKQEAIGVGVFDCPHCGKRITASEDLLSQALGSTGKCVECGNLFRKTSAPPRL